VKERTKEPEPEPEEQNGIPFKILVLNFIEFSRTKLFNTQ
jgi:hypothetical protein